MCSRSDLLHCGMDGKVEIKETELEGSRGEPSVSLPRSHRAWCRRRLEALAGQGDRSCLFQEPFPSPGDIRI